MTIKPSSDAQKRAAANYRQRNQGKSRLPGVLLEPDEAALLNEMAERYGSKKAAIIAGLKKLKNIDV
ncbi:hypothetical protein EU408_02000 [Salmonella enterica subsp. enterica]|nr:hypothetical protein [Salmonella enterica subsp. enterica]ECI6608952.1 hypothetical protein [Salmonella enterica subsp. enterica]